MSLNPKKTALIAVHFQHDIISREGAFGPFFAEQVQKREILANSSRLLQGARQAGAPVFYLRISYRKGYTDLVPNCPLLSMVAAKSALLDGAPLTELVPQVKPQDGDTVISHKRLSGFFDSELNHLLRARGIENVGVFGVATNISVEGTLRDAVNHGYNTFCVSDASSAADLATHEATLKSIAVIAQSLTVEDVIKRFKA